METLVVDEKKLEALVTKTVQEHLKLTLEDMDEVRRSPGAAVVRIETGLEALEKRIDRDMLTRAEFHKESGAMRAEFHEGMGALRTELKEDIWKLKLYFFLLAGLVVLTSPKVLDLFAKLLGIVK